MKNQKNVPLFTFTILILKIFILITIYESSFAKNNTCSELFFNTKNKLVNSFNIQNYHLDFLNDSEKEIFIQLKKFDVKYFNFNNEFFHDYDLIAILQNSDLPLYRENLKKLNDELTLEAVNNPSYNGILILQNALRKVLIDNHLTEPLIAKRMVHLKSKGKKNWKFLLGDLSLKETQENFYGNDIHNVSPDSLVGQYLAQTDAQTRIVQYPSHTDPNVLGPEKLFINVSANSFDLFKELILSNHNYMTVVGHAAVIHKGSFYSHGGKKSEIRIVSNNTPFPILLFKSTEAQRLNRYMETAVSPKYIGWEHPLKLPWMLEGYCAKGGFNCCTQWIGNIPIGDKLVTSYEFPPPDRGPDLSRRIQELQNYTITDDVFNEVKNFWKVPGHEQLANVIGQGDANVRGEMASPGWVIKTLINATDTERVPLVFVFSNDHRLPITDQSVNRLNYEPPR